jgi:hypothetical protein
MDPKVSFTLIGSLSGEKANNEEPTCRMSWIFYVKAGKTDPS